MNPEEKEKIIDLIYPAILSEMNRYRDWPIRVLTFTSVFHFAIIGYRLSQKDPFRWYVNFGLIIFVLILYFFTYKYFIHCHHNYIKNRNVQVKIQEILAARELKVFPSEWLKIREVSWKTGFFGWGFYFVYATGLMTATVVVLLINVVNK